MIPLHLRLSEKKGDRKMHKANKIHVFSSVISVF